jgi:hypothetical protein
LKKHVDANHSIIANKFEKEINIEIIESVERQLVKKRPNVPTSAISNFFVVKEHFKMMMCGKKTFCKTLVFLL